MLDTHHHLWAYSHEKYDWIPPGSPLAKDQLLPQLREATEAAGVTGTVAVQARQVIEESHDLLRMADQSDLIRGVVGWVPLISDEVEKDLEELARHPKFVGVRHVLQEELDDYFLRDDFHQGLARLPSHNLVYDLLLFQRQLPVATKLVDRQPELKIVIDHLAKPEVKKGRVDSDWKTGMKELAKRDHLRGVKFSGLTTEFPKQEKIDPDTIKAYFEETLEIFGAERVMFGTDWPVCLLRIDSYRIWADTVKELTSTLSPSERTKILLENGQSAYGLET